MLGKRSPELYCKGRKGYYNSTDTFNDIDRICNKGQKIFDVVEIEVYKILFDQLI